MDSYSKKPIILEKDDTDNKFHVDCCWITSGEYKLRNSNSDKIFFDCGTNYTTILTDDPLEDIEKMGIVDNYELLESTLYEIGYKIVVQSLIFSISFEEREFENIEVVLTEQIIGDFEIILGANLVTHIII